MFLRFLAPFLPMSKAGSKTPFLAQLFMAPAPIRIGRDNWWGLPFSLPFSPCLAAELYIFLHRGPGFSRKEGHLVERVILPTAHHLPFTIYFFFSMLHALCSMFYVLCSMLYASDLKETL
jgi:hypothetical protein